jgi:hypothetical protein
LDAEVARLLRWIVLPFGIAATIFGLALLTLLPRVEHPDWRGYALHLSPLLAAFLLLWMAAWLRRQELLDPANDGSVRRTVARYFAQYSAYALGASLVVGIIVRG